MLDRRDDVATRERADTPGSRSGSIVDLLNKAATRMPVPIMLAGAVCVALSSVFVPLAHVSTGTVTLFRSLISMPFLIPMALERVRADPAVASGTFVTTVTDVVGFFSFLGIATLWFGLK